MHPDERFEAEASRGRQHLVAELWGFLRAYRKWWLAPILVLLVLIGLFTLLASTGAAPFIYTLF